MSEVVAVAEPTFSRREERGLPAVQGGAVTPMQLLEIAVRRGDDIANLEKLMALQERWEANEAKREFVEALSAFKANPPEILKDKHVRYENKTGGFTEYDHATLGAVAVQIGQGLALQGLSHRWETEQGDQGVIKVSCILTHRRGHSERVWLQGSPDQSGGKNSIQAVGSTVTYLQRYTLFAITGLASRDQDDDGVGAGEQPLRMADELYKQFVARIQACTTKEKAQAACIEGCKECDKLNDLETYKALRVVLSEHLKFIANAKEKEGAK